MFYCVQSFLLAPHSSTLAWKIPWTEEPGRLQSMGSLGVGHDWLSDFTFIFHFHALGKEMATHSSVLTWRIPGTEDPGRRPYLGSHRVGHDWSDLAAVAAASTFISGFLMDAYSHMFFGFSFERVVMSHWCFHLIMNSVNLKHMCIFVWVLLFPGKNDLSCHSYTL